MGSAAAAYLYLSLPDVRPLRTRNPETTAFIELRLREARAKGQPASRAAVGAVCAHLPESETGGAGRRRLAFWQHEGVDFEQMKESMEVNIERLEFARGGSTITQQLAKNLYLSPSKNPIRKMREILIARRLEAELTKQRILELYLNVIEWGDGIYGAEAAARTYFGKSAGSRASEAGAARRRDRQSARVNPGHPTARLRRRQQMIMRRMGAVTPPPVVAETAAGERPAGAGRPLPSGDRPPSPNLARQCRRRTGRRRIARPVRGAPREVPPALTSPDSSAFGTC